MENVIVNCKYCGRDYPQPIRFYERNLKNGVNSFCSKSCSAKGRNNSDEYSPFRPYMKRIRASTHEYDIDVQYLKDVWNSQGGRCVYTGVPLVLTSRYLKSKTIGVELAASLDRINSDKGYIRGNIQFISMGMNLAKNDLSDLEFLRFIDAVRNNEPVYKKSLLVKSLESNIECY